MRYAAALLAGLTALVHIFIGGADTLGPLIDSNVPAIANYTLQGVWHMVSIFLLVSAGVFWRAGGGTRPIAAVWIVSGIVFLALGLLGGGAAGALALPQWALLIPTGALAVAARVQRLARAA